MKHHHHDSGHNHAHDERHFDHGEPELRLAECLDGNEINHHQQRQEHKLNQPFPAAQVNAEGVEERHEVRRDGRYLGHSDEHQHNPVRPAGEVPPPAADIATNKVDERVLAGVAVHHLANGAHENEHHDAHRNIDQNDGGAGESDASAGAEEQAGAYCSSDGDELNVAVFQPAIHFIIGV
jgi:hypothetical protein